MRLIKLIPICFLSIIAMNSCTISYSFTGTSLAPEIQSFSIYEFSNRARLVNPNLSDYFIEELRNKFKRQTSLEDINDGGHLEFEGTITGYDVQPIAIKDGDQASMNRLTVRIKVKFTNNKNHEQDFDTEFSAYDDFESSNLLSDVEDTLVEAIVEQIIEDIFNKSAANW